nr:single-stranded-DNA-specific exonuclease RecJ [Gammaproteobacteria bacterium]NIT63286.1 single-stranded-DNA-specific exonuclease RecJ [Gammaproteobacteria bacterium]NIY31866.1 single-stranded-DNA-specific exonuclease RecJ [Gammaproteobacteria bacterium]
MRAAKRIERRPVPDSIQALSQFHPVLARVYAARRIVSPAQVGTVLTHLHRADSLSQIDHAAELLARAVCEGQRILIVGDFDADGATSCALGVRALRAMGARDVQYLVPNRFEYGYGLTPEIVALAEQRAPRVLVTVDNGISSHEGVAAAKAAGMVVVITDHHLPGPALPPADAIVNPNQPGDGFPSKHLAGVGVIFYVLSALRAKLREADWFEVSGLGPPNLAQWLDLVALGTVADVVPLDDNNRILVAQGVARIRRGHCLPGVLALLEAAGRFHERVVASDLGYAVAPRLNAAGRLEDMSLGIECLLADDLEAARASARELDALNHARRGIEREMQEQALSLLQDIALDGDATQLPAGLCLYDSRWHQGVIGILAGRIKDRVHRPVIALADVGAG